MSAALRGPVLQPITVTELDAVMAIEVAAYPFPWTRGNFIDSLAAGYHLESLRTARGEWLGYSVAMAGYAEMHLLNLTVAPPHQGQGHGRLLLDALCARCCAHPAEQLWLEVRESNARAQALYARYGFSAVGRRRSYYPAGPGRREDAIVMSLPIAAAAPGNAHVD